MKEFLILKKTGETAPKDVNCAVKIYSENQGLTVSGEIYSGALRLKEYKICVVNGISAVTVSDGSALKFSKTLGREFLGGALVILLDIDDIPLLYHKYGNCEISLQDAVEKIKSLAAVYDDEVIATTNYYEGEFYETERVYNNLDGRDSEDKKEQAETQESSRPLLYEDVAQKSQVGIYYDRVKQKLEQIISTHEKDGELCKVIPGSEFVKIHYDNDRYYSVGRVRSGEGVKYICYAVRGEYGETPTELNNYCRFVPSSQFSPLSEGYYVIFQDAETGNVILT